MDEKTKHLLALGREHYANNEYEKAEKALVQVVREFSSFADVHNMLGFIYHAQGRFVQAQECFERALGINPNYTEAALNLAVTYNDLGRYADAKRVYTQAMQRCRAQPRSLDPFAKGKIANMHAELGDAYHGIGFFAEAVREYAQALALNPTFADIRTRLANTYRDMGDAEQAEREYREAIATNPSYVPARLHLGVTLYSTGRRAEAEAEWNEVLARDPENKTAQAYMRMLQAKTSEVPSPGSGEDPAAR